MLKNLPAMAVARIRSLARRNSDEARAIDALSSNVLRVDVEVAQEGADLAGISGSTDITLFQVTAKDMFGKAIPNVKASIRKLNGAGALQDMHGDGSILAGDATPEMTILTSGGDLSGVVGVQEAVAGDFHVLVSVDGALPRVVTLTFA